MIPLVFFARFRSLVVGHLCTSLCRSIPPATFPHSSNRIVTVTVVTNDVCLLSLHLHLLSNSCLQGSKSQETPHRAKADMSLRLLKEDTLITVGLGALKSRTSILQYFNTMWRGTVVGGGVYNSMFIHREPIL